MTLSKRVAKANEPGEGSQLRRKDRKDCENGSHECNFGEGESMICACIPATWSGRGMS
jgi:hypothetical protein